MSIFLVTFEVSPHIYLELDTSYAISAYNDIDEAMKKFESFERKACSENYETHISGSWGIIQLRPHIIKPPEETIEWLKPFILSDKPVTFNGGMSCRISCPGVRVSEDILKYSIIDVAKHVIDVVYGKSC